MNKSTILNVLKLRKVYKASCECQEDQTNTQFALVAGDEWQLTSEVLVERAWQNYAMDVELWSAIVHLIFPPFEIGYPGAKSNHWHYCGPMNDHKYALVDFPILINICCEFSNLGSDQHCISIDTQHRSVSESFAFIRSNGVVSICI